MNTRKLAATMLFLALLPMPIMAAKAGSISIQVTEADVKNGTASAVAGTLAKAGLNVTSICRIHSYNNSKDAPILGCWSPDGKEDYAQTSKLEANLDASNRKARQLEDVAHKYFTKSIKYTMDGLRNMAAEAKAKAKEASERAEKAQDDCVESIDHISIVRGTPSEQFQLAHTDLVIRHEREFLISDLIGVGRDQSSQDTTCESYGSDIYCNGPGGATLKVICAGTICTSRYSPGTPQIGNGKPLSTKQIIALTKIMVWRLHVRAHHYKAVTEYEIIGNDPGDVVAMVKEYKSHH